MFSFACEELNGFQGQCHPMEEHVSMEYLAIKHKRCKIGHFLSFPMENAKSKTLLMKKELYTHINICNEVAKSTFD